MFTNSTNLRFMFKHIQYCGSRWISLSSLNYYSNNPTIIDPPDLNPAIQSYKNRQGENMQRMKARLLYQSRKRGMLENGLLLSTFAAKFLSAMNEDQLHLYDKLINSPSNDWDLYYWATSTKPTPKEYQHEVMEMLKEHVQNSDRQCRIRQPDL